MPRSFEEIVDDLDRSGESTLAEELRRDYGKSTLRDRAGKAAELEKEIQAKDARIAQLERRPLQEKAFREANVDFDSLRPLERQALDSYDGELDPEKVGAFIEANQLPVTEGSIPGGETEPSGAAVTRAARQAPNKQRVGVTGQMTPGEAAEMAANDPEGWHDWSTKHPFEAEQLKKGVTVKL